jgi:hypothetical protein
MECLQIRPEQALAAFEAKMELDELAAYQHEMEQMILQPQKDFRCVSVVMSISIEEVSVFRILLL